MQFIRDIYTAGRAAGRPVISFEFFPPKTEEGDRNLLDKTLPALLQTKPDHPRSVKYKQARKKANSCYQLSHTAPI